ncbi:MAG: transglutaminase-like domain-containing protein, partial [Planctomycetota bacterium]
MKKIIIPLIFIFLLLSTHTLFAEDIDPAYLAETKECQFTPELKELAKELEYDPVKIYNWVYENVEYEDWYFGSQKGAYGTYLTKRGNAWDQCSLLIALLRICGISTRYVYNKESGRNDYSYVEALISIDNYRGNGN